MVYICELPSDIQNAISESVEEYGIYGEDLALAMNSKLEDLEDIFSDIYTEV